MKRIITLIFSLMLFSLSFGQNINRSKFEANLFLKPTLNVGSAKTISFKFYYPTFAVTQDSIWKYNTKVPIVSRLGINYVIPISAMPIEMVNDDADINVEVAFQEMPLGTTEVQTREATLGTGTMHSYMVNHKIPTIVKVTNRQGEVIDMWEEWEDNKIKYGDEGETKVKKNDNGSSTTSLTRLNFYDEESLEKSFQQEGEKTVRRKSVLKQAGRIIGSLHPRIYFLRFYQKLTIGTPKSKKHDYSELKAAQEAAIEALEAKDMSALDQQIEVWKKYIEEYDPYDKKAKINQKVKAILHGNLTKAYLMQDDLENARKHIGPYYDLSLKVSQSMTFPDLEQAAWLQKFIELQTEAYKTNADLEVPTTEYGAFDFESEIKKRRKLSNYQMFIVSDQTSKFTSEYKAFLGEPQDDPAPANDAPAESNLRAQVQFPGTANAMFVFSMENENLMGGPFPEEVTTFRDLSDIIGANMEFTSLPESIGNLENLSLLNLKGNKFTSIPASIGKLSKLTNLNLRGNQLTEIPESIGQLTNLKKLNVRDNDLTTLPESIKNCTQLKSLQVSGNKISADELEKIKQWLPAKCKVK